MNKFKVKILLGFFFTTTVAFSQIGIGTTNPDDSSILDITSNNKGISFPNINLLSETDATTINTPKSGLMVYNTNTAMPCGKGLYFNNGTSAAPIWSCFSKTTKTYSAYSTASITAINNTIALQPGCTITFTVPTGQTADVKIDASIGASNVSTNSNRINILEALVHVDNSPLAKGGWNRISIVNNNNTSAITLCPISTVWTNVSAGTHTIKLLTSRYDQVGGGSSDLIVGGDCVTSTNCGEIHATVTYR